MGQEPDAAPAVAPEAKATPDEPGQEPKGKSESKLEGDGKQPDTFDRDYVEKLRSEAAETRKKLRDAETKAQELEDRDKSERERAEAKAEREAKRAAEAEAKLLRYEVANEKNVPAKLVPLLTATTKEALSAQADLILENAKPAEATEFNGGPRTPAPEQRTPEQAHNDFVLEQAGIQPRRTT